MGGQPPTHAGVGAGEGAWWAEPELGSPRPPRAPGPLVPAQDGAVCFRPAPLSCAFRRTAVLHWSHSQGGHLALTVSAVGTRPHTQWTAHPHTHTLTLTLSHSLTHTHTLDILRHTDTHTQTHTLDTREHTQTHA